MDRFGKAGRRGLCLATPRRAPSMNVTLEVEVLPKVGHNDRSEPQGRKGDRPSGGSGERSRGPTNRNRIRGGVGQGERATDREALVTKAQTA